MTGEARTVGHNNYLHPTCPPPPLLPSFPHPEILPISSSSSSHSCRSSRVTANRPSRNSHHAIALRHLGGPAAPLCSAFPAKKKIRGAHIDLAFCLPPATKSVTHGDSIAVETAGGGGDKLRRRDSEGAAGAGIRGDTPPVNA